MRLNLTIAKYALLLLQSLLERLFHLRQKFVALNLTKVLLKDVCKNDLILKSCVKAFDYSFLDVTQVFINADATNE